jgi:hypothetical protein
MRYPEATSCHYVLKLKTSLRAQVKSRIPLLACCPANLMPDVPLRGTISTCVIVFGGVREYEHTEFDVGLKTPLNMKLS